jgi:hypothetical protein
MIMHYRASAAATGLALFLLLFACQPEQSDSSRRSVNGKNPGAGTKTENGGTTEGGTTEGGTTEGGTTEGGTTEGGSDSPDPQDPYEANGATWHQETRAILDQHCNTCHATQEPLLNTYDSVLGVAENVKDVLVAGIMPPSGGLSDSDKNIMIGWVKSDA